MNVLKQLYKEYKSNGNTPSEERLFSFLDSRLKPKEAMPFDIWLKFEIYRQVDDTAVAYNCARDIAGLCFGNALYRVTNWRITLNTKYLQESAKVLLDINTRHFYKYPSGFIKDSYFVSVIGNMYVCIGDTIYTPYLFSKFSTAKYSFIFTYMAYLHTGKECRKFRVAIKKDYDKFISNPLQYVKDYDRWINLRLLKKICALENVELPGDDKYKLIECSN